jgi:hypothetical protein
LRLLLAALLASLGISLAQAAPQHSQANYRLLKNGQQVGVVVENFSQAGNHYTLESETTAIGIFALLAKGKIRLSSRGEVTADGLRPRHFEHHRGADPAKLITADFDWDGQTATHKFDGETESAPLLPGTQDRLSFLYQFMFKPPRKEEIRFPMSTGKKLNLYRYRLIGEEQITTPAGRFDTLHLSKRHAADEDGAEIWLAKSRHYFPVRILFAEKDGGRIEQILTALAFGDEGKD